MIYFLYTLHIFISIFLILVVLLQQGKGADLSVFGGGTTQAAFGARGAATLLHKLTVGCFVLFIVTTVSIGIMQRGANTSSVLSGVEAGAGGDAEEATPAAEAAADTPAAADTSADAAPAAEEAAQPDAGADTEDTTPDP